MSNDGGPAFPRPVSEDKTQGTQHDGNRTVDAQDGMSLRDYFAAQALGGLLAGSAAMHVTIDGSWVDGREKTLATFSYSLADAMLVARKKGA